MENLSQNASQYLSFAAQHTVDFRHLHCDYGDAVTQHHTRGSNHLSLAQEKIQIQNSHVSLSQNCKVKHQSSHHKLRPCARIRGVPNTILIRQHRITLRHTLWVTPLHQPQTFSPMTISESPLPQLLSAHFFFSPPLYSFHSQVLLPSILLKSWLFFLPLKYGFF